MGTSWHPVTPRKEELFSIVLLLHYLCLDQAVTHPNFLSVLFILVFCFSLHTNPIDQIEKQQRHQRKSQNGQVWIEIPKIGHHHIAKGCNLGDKREYLLISETINDCANEKTKQTRDKII